MGQALYRQYRIRKLSEMVGQEAITTTLEHALKQGTFSHAYLFTGPRGSGKTSIARILAHEINELPYTDDSMHLDIIEIDAASNRRIEEIRDLRDKVYIAPTSAKYKVYIIDEVHMLTKEAFNALLKTLEEPPAHVIFILATTEAHKLPETIVSRTQRFTFKPVETNKIVAHLLTIAKQEHIDVTDDALQLIAEHGEGSFRDSISLLDQARNHDRTVTLEEVQRMLGIAPNELISQLIEDLETHNAPGIAEGLASLQNQGYEAAQVAKQLGQQLRSRLLANKSKLPHDITIALLGNLVSVPASPDPRSSLEIALLDIALTEAQSTAVTPAIAVDTPTPTTPKTSKQPAPTATTKTTSKQPLEASIWPEVLNSIKGHHNTLYGIIRGAQPHFSEDSLVLEFEHGFHKKQLDQQRNREIVAAAVEALTGQTVFVQCRLSTKDTTAKQSVSTDAPLAKNDNALTNISNIFGGGELLES